MEVDPFILSVIEDPAAPQRRFRTPVMPPASLPGELGVRASLKTIHTMLMRGAPGMVADAERWGEIHKGMQLWQPIVNVWDPEQVQKILRNDERAYSSAMGWDSILLSRVYPQDGNQGGLLARDFESHRGARKLVAPAFTPKAVRGYSELAEPLITQTVARWKKRGRVSFKREARQLLSEVANSIFTGVEDPAERVHIDRSLSDAWHGVDALSENPLLSPTVRRARRGYANLLQTFGSLLRARRAHPGRDLLSQLAMTGDTFDDAALVGIFTTIMFGAYDTTSAAVTSLAYLLAKHPGWQERLRAEAMALPRDALDPLDLQAMEKFDWAWKESLRLMPTTAYAPRRTLREVELLGHVLPAGCLVAAVLGPLGRHPSYWRDADRFDPERFAPHRAEDRQRPGIYAPFGAGPHTCIGMQLAALEAKLLFHRLLTRCRFELARDYQAHHTYGPIGTVSGNVELKLVPL